MVNRHRMADWLLYELCKPRPIQRKPLRKKGGLLWQNCHFSRPKSADRWGGRPRACGQNPDIPREGKSSSTAMTNRNAAAFVHWKWDLFIVAGQQSQSGANEETCAQRPWCSPWSQLHPESLHADQKVRTAASSANESVGLMWFTSKSNSCSRQVLKVWEPGEDCSRAEARWHGGKTPDRRRHRPVQPSAVSAQTQHHGPHCRCRFKELLNNNNEAVFSAFIS